MQLAPFSQAVIDAATPVAAAVAFPRPILSVRRITPACGIYDATENMPDSERSFVVDSRRGSRKRERNRENAAERFEEDTRSIERLAMAMLDLAAGDVDAVRGLDRATVADDADVDVKAAKRLWKDGVALARWNGRELTSEERGLSERERDKRIALQACTADAGAVRVALGKKDGPLGDDAPYSERHKRIVDYDIKRTEYLNRIRYELSPGRFTITGDQRFGAIGYVFDATARVGGSRDQPGGGTCLRLPFVEYGKRSAESPLVLRLVHATAKVGVRRRGIQDKKVIKRILDLHAVDMPVEQIAADDLVREKVSRVKGVIHASENDGRFFAGLNNDKRMVHMYKRDALDEIHGNTRTDCRELIRLDKDWIFESWEDCRLYLLTLRVQPQQVVWVRDDEFPERVTKPHLLYWLPDGAGVWYNNSVQKAMLDAVAVALTRDAGGDIGGLANIGDCKLPTSPHTDYVDWNAEHLPTLSELCEILDVDLKMGLERGMRALSVEQMVAAGIDEQQSGIHYSLFLKRAWEICDHWQGRRLLRVGADLDRRTLATELFDALLEDMYIVPLLADLDEKQREAAETAIGTAAKKVAEGLGRAGVAGLRGYDIGAAETEVAQAVADALENAAPDLTAEELDELKLKAALRTGGTYAKRVQVARNVRRVADAMAAISFTGAVPTQAAVREITDMDPRTVKKHWDPAVTLLAASRIVAAVIAPTEDETTGATVPTLCSGVWGVNLLSDLHRQAVGSQQVRVPAPVEAMTLASVLAAPIKQLVDRLPVRQSTSRAPFKGGNMLAFCRNGWTVYRSAGGFRQQSSALRKGLRVDPRPVDCEAA